MTRRTFFLLGSAAASNLTRPRRAVAASDKLVIACIGARGRAGHLNRGFAAMPEIEIAMLCDVDSRQFEAGVKGITATGRKEPRLEADFRRALDDKSIDAVVIGTPDHWHAIPAILACQAGKHVYVEKPCSHNVKEGQAMLAAARKHQRVMQVGIQSRSQRHLAEAMEFIRTGALGKVVFARAWETSVQRAVPRVPDTEVPAGVDYDMWLGPAPKRAFNAARFHSNWRWFFDYGTGDLGNDGVHRLDYARRGLEAGFTGMKRTLPEWPTRISAGGGKLFFDDVQEFPDTMMVTFEYGKDAMLVYEMRVWTPNAMEGEEEGAMIYGENGAVVIGNEKWRAIGRKGEVLHPGSASGNDQADPAHKADFLAAIRKGSKPACDIHIGHVASSLTHLGNIAWRVDRKLRFDPATQAFEGDEDANRLLGRTYREPWVLPQV